MINISNFKKQNKTEIALTNIECNEVENETDSNLFHSALKFAKSENT
jgi:hypothetical protein